MTKRSYDHNEAAIDAAPISGRRRRAQRLLALILLGVTGIAGVAASKNWLQPTSPPGEDVKLQFQAGQNGPVSLEGRLDRGAVLSGGDGIVKMEMVIRGEAREESSSQRVPTDLVLILDRSGSMQGEPLHRAKAAVRDLIGRLGEGDRLALISYASGAQLSIPLSAATPDARASWSQLLHGVHAQGGTNMSSGLDLAFDVVRNGRGSGRVSRVLLLSDGHANEGDSSREGLHARATAALGQELVLSTVGVGAGFDESLMSALADAGTGNFYYLRDGGELGSVFEGEFAAARETQARALALEMRPGSRVELIDAAGYPLHRNGSKVRVEIGPLASGQERRIWLTLRAHPGVEDARLQLGDFALRFVDAQGEEQRIAFADSPWVRVEAAEEEFLAAVDTDAYVRQLEVDEVNALKQGIASSVEKGDFKDALKRVRSFRASAAEMYGRLNVAPAQSGALMVADDMEQRMQEASAPEAKAEVRRKLAKELLSEGVDGRRVGAKHK